MFRSRKKKTSFEPVSSIPFESTDAVHADEDIHQGLEDPEEYPETRYEPRHEPRYEPRHEHRSHRAEPMSRSNPQQILNSLASSSNQFAAGIALCVKALAEATAGPPPAPVVVDYYGLKMVFGRRTLARMDGHEAIKMAVRAIYPPAEGQRITVDAVLFTEDGKADRRAVPIDMESWEELLPHIHSIYLRDRDRDKEKDKDRYRTRETRERPRRDSNAAVERRDDRPVERRDDRPHGELVGEPPPGLERSRSQNEGYSPGGP